ncbi:MAG: VWA domain-containing protein [Spirochaetia bacterium]|jgi:hypothetical protein|nr:VWA domain-containing protein [Spirochaetia bacterium]
MTKRIGIVALLAIAISVPGIVAQERVDVVVLLDSSRSMSQYYNQVVDYVLSQTVKEYLRFGDAFHLLSFSDSTQVEIAQVLRTEKDLRSVVARLYLLYPLGKNTDLVTALKNVYRYVSDLPENSIKHIILISDGLHSPATGSQYADLDSSGVKNEIERTAARIKEHGWTMRIVRVPFDGAFTASAGSGDAERGRESGSTSPGSGDYLSDVASAVGTSIQTFDPSDASASVVDSVDLPLIRFPSDLGVKDYAFSMAVDVSNRGSRSLSLELSRLLLEDGSDVLTNKVFAELAPGKSSRLTLKVLLPESLPEGKIMLSLEPRFADGIRVAPAISTVSVEIKKAPLAAFFRNSALVALFIVILAIACTLIILVVLYLRRLHRKAEEPIVEAFLDSAAPRSSALEENRHGDAAVSRSAAALLAASKDTSHKALGTSQETTRHEAPTTFGKTQANDTKATAASIPAAASNADSTRGPESRASSLLEAWNTSSEPRRSLPLAETRSEIPVAKQAPVHYEPKVVRHGSTRILFRVHGQNPNIGKRNIRAMHAGGRSSVGGGSSDFLVFLLPVPRRIAHLYYDGQGATLVPARPEFFPDYDGPIEACLDKDIRILTARGKELVIRFERYEAPVDRLNKILHCIETPGLWRLPESFNAGESADTTESDSGKPVD